MPADDLALRIDECEAACTAMKASYPDLTILINSFFEKRIEDHRAEFRAQEMQK